MNLEPRTTQVPIAPLGAVRRPLLSARARRSTATHPFLPFPVPFSLVPLDLPSARFAPALRAIHAGSQTLEAFVARVGAQLEHPVAEGRALGSIAVPPRPAPAPKPSTAPKPGTSAVNRCPAKKRKQKKSC
jgi:hypothetical protein